MKKFVLIALAVCLLLGCVIGYSVSKDGAKGSDEPALLFDPASIAAPAQTEASDQTETAEPSDTAAE